MDDEVYRIIGISITFFDRKSNRDHLIFCLNQFDELLVSNGELFMKKTPSTALSIESGGFIENAAKFPYRLRMKEYWGQVFRANYGCDTQI